MSNESLCDLAASPTSQQVFDYVQCNFAARPAGATAEVVGALLVLAVADVALCLLLRLVRTGQGIGPLADGAQPGPLLFENALA